jgi:hypothetical protein
MRSEALEIAVVFLVLIFHFLVSVIVSERYPQHAGMVLFISLVGGWTLLGWVGSGR